MKYVIFTILILYICHLNKANALEFSISQGVSYHFQTSNGYNDSVFKDNKTTLNTILTLNHNNYSATLLSDSQGTTSIALIRSIRLYKRFSLITGIYVLRDNKIRKYEPQAPILAFPSIDIGSRVFLITPLVGIQHSLLLTDSISLDTLLTPAFVLLGVSIKVGL